MTDMFDAPEWRIYQINDCEWYIARFRDEAIAAAVSAWGCESVDQAVIEEMLELDEVFELGDESLDGLYFVDSDENENPLPATRRTFREELMRRIEAGLSEPEFFAATEY